MDVTSTNLLRKACTSMRASRLLSSDALFALTLITLFEVTESAGVVKPADFFS